MPGAKRVAIGVLAAAGVMAAGHASPAADAAATIRAEDLLREVAELTSPRYAGRLAGSPGYARAAADAARRFARLGLQPAGTDRYLQEFAIEYNRIDACRLTIRPHGGEARTPALGEEFTCRGFTGSGSVAAPVIFAGWGVTREDLGWDDYAGIDARGKIVLVFKDAPPFDPPSGTAWGDSTLPRPKALNAIDHGAIGLLMVSAPREGRVGPPIASVLHGPGVHPAGFPQQHVSGDVAAELLAPSGLSLEGLAAEIADARAPRPRPLAASASMTVAARYRPDQPTANVVALLPGADPALRDEIVLVGAHLDHVGGQGEEIYWPGANDNASGSAALMAVAEALSRAPERPARSVAFVLFAAEEQGLNGSRWFVEHPPFPLERVVAMLNLDCIGAGEKLQIGNGKSAPRLWELVRGLDAAGAGVTIEETWAGGGADATPFFEHGVPAAYFATTKGYRHLHQLEDTTDALNPALYEEAGRLVLRAVREIANGGYEREAVAD